MSMIARDTEFPNVGQRLLVWSDIPVLVLTFFFVNPSCPLWFMLFLQLRCEPQCPPGVKDFSADWEARLKRKQLMEKS